MAENDAGAVRRALAKGGRPRDARDDDAMRRRVESRLFGGAELATIGRFEVLRRLGEGGGGTVYEARDPSLDRKVALKVLRPHAGGTTEESGSTRTRSIQLLREAKTLAKLTHPHLVHVYEVGEHNGGVFVVMELVEGCDLRTWQTGRGKRASLRERLRILRELAGALEAAHRVGIVHGDVKPGNVLVANDGRAKLADFGLARILESDRDDRPSTVAGTPAYMAPEQHAAEAVGFASDIYSFCATAYEVLCGKRPFAGSSVLELELAKRKGPPGLRRGSMPRRVWRVLERGLRVEPEQRPRSMAEVRRALAPRRRSVAIAAGLVAAGGLGLAMLPDASPQPCERTAQALAGIWDDDTRLGVRRVYVAGGSPEAEAAWGVVAAELDAYAGAWIAAQRDNCEATHVRGEQSEALLDRRTICMRDRLAALHGVVSALGELPPRSYTNPKSATRALADVASCGAAAVERAADSEEDPEAARVRLAKLTAADTRMGLGGDYATASSQLGELSQEAEAAGNLRQAAAGLRQQAIALDFLSKFSEAEAVLRRAIVLAERGGHDEQRAEAYVVLARMLTRVLGKPDEALTLLDQAGAILERADFEGSSILPSYYSGRAAALERTGDDTGSLAAAKRAVTEYRDRYGDDDFRVARALNRVGAAATNLEQLELASSALEEALAIDTADLGETHPHVIPDMINLGAVRAMQGDHDGGVALLQEARRITEINFPDGHRAHGAISHRLGEASLLEGRNEDALAEFRRALASHPATDRTTIAKSQAGIGRALTALGRSEEARSELDQALTELRTHDANARDVAVVQGWLAKAVGLEDPEAGFALGKEALATMRTLQIPPSQHIADLEAFLATATEPDPR